MEQKFNNEVIGISAEIAVADIFNVTIDSIYRTRGNEEIVNLLKKNISKIFSDEIFKSPIKSIISNVFFPFIDFFNKISDIVLVFSPFDSRL